METLSTVFKLFITNQTFWTALGAIAALVAAIGVFIAARQIKFTGWLRAQEIFTHQDFIRARKDILQYFGYEGEIASRIGEADEESAKFVCRKMDELACLKPFLGKHKILDAWGFPLGKSWMILEPTVLKVREIDSHPRKWIAFQRLGEAAKKKLHLEDINRSLVIEKHQGQAKIENI